MITDYEVIIRKLSREGSVVTAVLERQLFTLYSDTLGDRGYSQKSIEADLELRPIRYKANDGMMYTGRVYKLLRRG
jgi:hypothetical protein